jgi:hypothetical protein
MADVKPRERHELAVKAKHTEHAPVMSLRELGYGIAACAIGARAFLEIGRPLQLATVTCTEQEIGVEKLVFGV